MDDDHAIAVRASGRRWRTPPTGSPCASRSCTRCQVTPNWTDCYLRCCPSGAVRWCVWVTTTGFRCRAPWSSTLIGDRWQPPDRLPFDWREVTVVAPRGLPEADTDRVRRWCDQRVPERVRDQVRIECEEAARHLTIVECRAPWHNDSEWTRLPVARLGYTRTTGTWTLHCRDRNLRFRRYDLIPPTTNLMELLDELDRDPAAIFWG